MAKHTILGESYCAGTAVVAAYPASRICPTTNGGDSNFVIPLTYGPLSNGPGGAALVPTAFPAAASFTTANNGLNGLEWPINNGWLLVEVKWAADGLWHGVTSEWLGLGFARGLQVPTSPGTPYRVPASNSLAAYGSNFLQDHANAILYFQQTADRNGNNTITGPGAGTDGPVTASYFGAGSQYNWYPINLYDAREGENNDVSGNLRGWYRNSERDHELGGTRRRQLAELAAWYDRRHGHQRRLRHPERIRSLFLRSPGNAVRHGRTGCKLQDPVGRVWIRGHRQLRQCGRWFQAGWPTGCGELQRSFGGRRQW